MEVTKIEHGRHDFDGVDIWKRYDEEHYDTFVFSESYDNFLSIEIHDDGEIVYHFKKDGKSFIYSSPLMTLFIAIVKSRQSDKITFGKDVM